MYDEVPRGQPGAPAPAPEDREDALDPSDGDVSQGSSSTNVRTNFPETWIWTEATTECVIHITSCFSLL